MKTSESIINISKALLLAQKNMGGAVKDSKNPFFKSSYSDYNSVLAVVKDPLNAAGILLTQPTIVREGKTLVETTLVHAESGEYFTSEIEVVTTKDRDPQNYGSAITYARRYSLQSMLSIPSVDDDGEAAMYRGQASVVTSGHMQTIPQAAAVAAVLADRDKALVASEQATTKPRGFRRIGQAAAPQSTTDVPLTSPVNTTSSGLEF